MIDRTVALCGTTEPQPEQVVLKAGPLLATLENGALRWVRLGAVEVLRGIAFLVRDRSWNTPIPEISNLRIEHSEDGFRVTFSALCRTDDGELPWSAEITGDANGTLRFTGTAHPARDFVTNRTGFVVLHPLDNVAGCPVEVTHVDGRKRRARFPGLIDPEQCFFDVRALSHEAMTGVWATCTMEGDAWEMEDHRNWLDASFKTYVRPLALPHPYTIDGGSKVTQSVTLAFSGAPTQARGAADSPVQVVLGGAAATRMPAVGLRAPLQWIDEASAAAEFAKQARPQLLNGRIDPRRGHGTREITRLGALAAAIGADLALELVAACGRDPYDELADFAENLKASGVQPESIAVAPAEDRIRLEPGAPPPPLALLGEVYSAARVALPGAVIGGGTFGFFTELNRNWPPFGLIDYVAHVACSVVHASDDRSMMENLESFDHMARTIRACAGDKPYRLIASGIGLDAGPYGEPAPNPNNIRSTMVRMDPRHRGLFGAAWTLASAAAAARNGLAAISPAALVGELGIVYRPLPYRQPWFDAIGRAAVYPVYHVVAGLADGAGRPRVEVSVSDRTLIEAIAHRGAAGETVLWLANLRETPQRIALSGFAGSLRVGRLDDSTFEAAAFDPLFLRAHAAALASGEIEIGAYGLIRVEIGG